MTTIAVALGGALGATLRHLLVLASLRAFGPAFPWGVLAVNASGSFAMGVLAALLAARGPGPAAAFAMTGVLGGFTTFSAFSLDAARLWERGRADLAAAYVLGSVALSLGGVALGLALGRVLASEAQA